MILGLPPPLFGQCPKFFFDSSLSCHHLLDGIRFKVVVENDLRKEEFEEIDDENNEEINVKQESEATEAV